MNKLFPKKISHKITLLLLPLVVFGLLQIHPGESSAHSYGGLIIDTGVPKGGPMFTEDDFKPGDCKTHKITVKNDTKTKKDLTVRSANVEETGNLSKALTITISQGDNVLYEESFNKFLEDSKSLNGITLDSLAPGQIKKYSFKICFKADAGNEFQKKRIKFDFIFGDMISPVELPAECQHLTGKITSVIRGSDKNDHIKGTSASELILGFAGNDRIDGNGGDDCIVGGEGNDKLESGTGEDVLLGGAGNDKLDGQTGNDRLYGEAGNDELFGGTGNDYLDGGADVDFLKGETGTDTCVNGESVHSSCEL